MPTASGELKIPNDASEAARDSGVVVALVIA
jgi:hypothetical protein